MASNLRKPSLRKFAGRHPAASRVASSFLLSLFAIASSRLRRSSDASNYAPDRVVPPLKCSAQFLQSL